MGSNLGDKAAQLRQALRQLERSGIRIDQASPVYRTEPVDLVEQDWFLNQVVKVFAQEQPYELLQICQAIEQAQGRERRIPKGPRTLDLDLLLYDELVLTSDTLTLPHPRMHLRRFVLEPLAMLAPELVHPVLKKSIARLLDTCPDRAKVLRLGN